MRIKTTLEIVVGTFGPAISFSRRCYFTDTTLEKGPFRHSRRRALWEVSCLPPTYSGRNQFQSKSNELERHANSPFMLEYISNSVASNVGLQDKHAMLHNIRNRRDQRYSISYHQNMDIKNRDFGLLNYLKIRKLPGPYQAHIPADFQTKSGMESFAS